MIMLLKVTDLLIDRVTDIQPIQVITWLSIQIADRGDLTKKPCVRLHSRVMQEGSTIPVHQSSGKRETWTSKISCPTFLRKVPSPLSIVMAIESPVSTPFLDLLLEATYFLPIDQFLSQVEAIVSRLSKSTFLVAHLIT